MTIINLICLLAIVVASLIYMGLHRKGTFIYDKDNKLSPEQMRLVNRDSNRLFATKIVALLIAVASALQFFLTEEMTYDFKAYNNWTIFQAGLLVLLAGVIFFGVRDLNKAPPIEEEQETDDDWDDEDGF